MPTSPKQRPEDKRFIVVTAGVIFKNDKVLITQRPESSYFAGKWEFPGGKKRDDETLVECLVREIREELNIEIEVQKHLGTIEHEFQNFFIQLHLFRCKHIEGIPEPDEKQKWQWISLEQLGDFDFTEPDRMAIEKLKLAG